MLFVICEANYIGTKFVSTGKVPIFKAALFGLPPRGKLSSQLTDEGLYLICAVIYKSVIKISPHPSASRPPSPEGEGKKHIARSLFRRGGRRKLHQKNGAGKSAPLKHIKF